jgi:hypothetical protein
MYPESVCLKNQFAVVRRALIRISCAMMLCSHAGAESSVDVTPEVVGQLVSQATSVKQETEGPSWVISQGEHRANKEASSEDGAMVVSLIEPAYTSLDGGTTLDRPSDAASAGKDAVVRMPYAVEVAVIGLLGLVIVARRKWNSPR